MAMAMCKTQTVVHEEEKHFYMLWTYLVIEMWSVQWNGILVDLFSQKQWLMMSAFNKNVYCKILSSFIFVY